MRKVVRALLPLPILKAVGSMLVKRRAERLSRLPIAEAFDEVYRKKMWQQGTSLSGPGSEGKWAQDYVKFVSAYIQEHNCRTVADVGCGDFMVGQHLAPYVKTFLALDVSMAIIDINRNKFVNLKNVTFDTLNIIEDAPPPCDLLLLRQVLQHLTNTQVEAALCNIERARPRRVLITEEVYHSGQAAHVNVDLTSHSIVTRVAQKSGLDIAAPPFDRLRNIAATLEPGAENLASPNSRLCIYEMQFAE